MLVGDSGVFSAACRHPMHMPWQRQSFFEKESRCPFVIPAKWKCIFAHCCCDEKMTKWSTGGRMPAHVIEKEDPHHNHADQTKYKKKEKNRPDDLHGILMGSYLWKGGNNIICFRVHWAMHHNNALSSQEMQYKSGFRHVACCREGHRNTGIILWHKNWYMIAQPNTRRVFNMLVAYSRQPNANGWNPKYSYTKLSSRLRT